MKKVLCTAVCLLMIMVAAAQNNGGWTEFRDFDPLGTGFSLGRYSYANNYVYRDVVYKVQVRQKMNNSDEKQIKIYDWGKGIYSEKGIDLMIDWNAGADPNGYSNRIYLRPQAIGMKDEGTGKEIKIMDMPCYYNDGVMVTEDLNYSMTYGSKYDTGCCYYPEKAQFFMSVAYAVETADLGLCEVFAIGYNYTHETLTMGATDVPTGINDIRPTPTLPVREGEAYNLAGQRVLAGKVKGMVVVGNKKMVR